MAAGAAAHGKGFLVEEHAWSAPSAPAVERAAVRTPTVHTTAPWSLHADGDLHNGGPAAFGGHDAPLYVPGTSHRERSVVSRLREHARVMAR